MAAVLVPPSAWSTSQSSMIEFSPSAFRSMQARSDRPISREISCVRPPTRPLTDSRSLRVLVDRGSIAYSAVTQPRPPPRRQRGTSSSTLAAQSTLVEPNSTSTEPSAWSSHFLVMVTSRSWSGRRPSGREDMLASVAVAPDRCPRPRAVPPAGLLVSATIRCDASRARALAGGAVRGACLDPGADRSDAVGQGLRRGPAEIRVRPADGERAALELAGPGRRQRVAHRPAGHRADHAGQVKDADLRARADVPRPRHALVRGGEERADGVADVHVVAGLGAVAEYRRLASGEYLRAEDRHHARLAGRVLPGPVHVGEPQHGVVRSVQPVVQAEVLLGAVLGDPVRRLG